MKKIYKLLSLTILMSLLFLTGCINKPLSGINKSSVTLHSKNGETATIKKNTESRTVATILREFEDREGEAEYKYTFHNKSGDFKGKVTGIFGYEYEKDDDEYITKSYTRANITYKLIKSKYQIYDEQDVYKRLFTSAHTYKTLGYLQSGIYNSKNNIYMIDNKFDFDEGLPTTPASYNPQNATFIEKYYSDTYTLYRMFDRVRSNLNIPEEYESGKNAYVYTHKIKGKYIILTVEQPFGLYNPQFQFSHKHLIETFANYRLSPIDKVVSLITKATTRLYKQTIYFNTKTNQIDYCYIYCDKPLFGLEGTVISLTESKFTFEAKKVNKENKIEREVENLLRYVKRHALYE